MPWAQRPVSPWCNCCCLCFWCVTQLLRQSYSFIQCEDDDEEEEEEEKSLPPESFCSGSQRRNPFYFPMLCFFIDIDLKLYMAFLFFIFLMRWIIEVAVFYAVCYPLKIFQCLRGAGWVVNCGLVCGFRGRRDEFSFNLNQKRKKTSTTRSVGGRRGGGHNSDLLRWKNNIQHATAFFRLFAAQKLKC